MDSLRIGGLCLVLLMLATPAWATPMGSALTYQGRLTDAGSPAHGTVDLTFQLYDAAAAGAAVGPLLTRADVPVDDGYFTVELDFGAVFEGSGRWLQIAVRPGSSAGLYTPLSPRQKLAPAPHAQYAATAGSVVGGALGGSGSNGYLAKWLSGSNLGNSNIFESSGRIGIGTTAPDEDLVIGSPLGSGWAIPALTVGGPSGGGFSIGSTDGYKLSIDSTSIFGRTRIRTNSPAGVGTGLIEFITDQIAISTNSPDAHARLHVAHDDYYAGYFTSSLASSSTRVLHAKATAVGNYDAVAVYGESTPADYYGIGGRFIGGYHGAEGTVSATGAGTYTGLLGQVTGGTGTGRGVYATSTGGGTNYGLYCYASGGSSNYGLYAQGSSHAGWFNGDVKVVGNVEIYNGSTKVIELGAGLDYAEGFDVAPAETTIEPGSVLVIDPANPGKLALALKAYDSKVAGIVAGANGLGSGVRLGAGEFDHDVALAGRVYCKVDATDQAIEPGDLLTTSDRPGYAMKATDLDRARGATLGKAMEHLEKGATGQILVLVTLQ